MGEWEKRGGDYIGRIEEEKKGGLEVGRLGFWIQTNESQHEQ